LLEIHNDNSAATTTAARKIERLENINWVMNFDGILSDAFVVGYKNPKSVLVHFEIPKAFANFSPTVGAQRRPWDQPDQLALPEKSIATRFSGFAAGVGFAAWLRRAVKLRKKVAGCAHGSAFGP
jgi:hypothetical protein